MSDTTDNIKRHEEYAGKLLTALLDEHEGDSFHPLPDSDIERLRRLAALLSDAPVVRVVAATDTVTYVEGVESVEPGKYRLVAVEKP